MSVFDRDIKRLLVEAAIAAPNHGLFNEAQGLLEVLPALHLDDSAQALTTAMVRFGLRQPRAALEAIKSLEDDNALALRAVIVEYLEHFSI